MIGGGLAGLAAGVALAESGWRVRLREQRPFLGGRATSYALPHGEQVDNCQHVTFGCCTNLEDFYGRIGSTSSIKFFERLLLLDPQGRRGEMHAGILPAPLHMIGSFLTFGPLNLRDKFSIVRAFYAILRHAGNPPELKESGGISMLDWLRRQKQTPSAITRFWRAVLVSALSEELESIDARYGVDVFWKAVLSNRSGHRMGIPVTPLGQLYDRCKSALDSKGGEVLLRAAVRKLLSKDGELVGVRLEGEREERADAYILAVPHDVCWDLLPEDHKHRDPALQNIPKLRDAPITGVHFWFDRMVMHEPFIGLLDSTTQWIFNKTQLYAGASGNGVSASSSQYLQLVVSASYDLLEKPRQEIIDLCLKELRQVLPASRNANLVKATVIKEAAATFSPYPGVDRWRPQQRTSIRRLYLAGDWTDTGWPATMEGAVRSGYLAAEAVLRDEGTKKRFLRPDLPADGLVRVLMRGCLARGQ